jgi:hypothetical protein
MDPAPVFLHGFAVQPHVPIAGLRTNDSPSVFTAAEVARHAADILEPVIAESKSSLEPAQVLMRIAGAHPNFLIEWPGLLAAHVHQTEREGSIRFLIPPSVPQGFESLLMSPSIGALATLSGRMVLHGSAVELDGEATILLAEAGGGKSSVTALLCNGGARILSEDVSVLTSSEGSVIRCFSGVHELRLRNTNLWLADLPGFSRPSTHADGRVVLRPEPTAQTDCPVKTITVVRLDRSAQKISIDTIPAAKAVAWLMLFQRTPIVPTHPLAVQMFDQAVRIASQVQMAMLTVPWSEHHRTVGLAAQLVQAVRNR